jgi:1-acyl-sn-glycerol-3-phosphate acyltransferase
MPQVPNARAAMRAAALGAWSLGATQVARLHGRFTPPGEREVLLDAWVRAWARGLVALLGVEERIVAAAPPRARGARLVVSNHRSPLDILLMLEHCGGVVLARADLERWPILGRAAREGGTIFVDRADPRSGARAIRAIRARLVAGRTVTVFPEGTTYRGDEVRPFHGGAFSAVRGLDTEILPVGVAYEPGAEFFGEAFGAYLARMAGRPRIPLALCFGAPRVAVGGREDLARGLRDEVQALVHRARASLDAGRATRG